MLEDFLSKILTVKNAVLGLGLIAQGGFGLRLLVQLYFAEKKKTTEPPTLFWYISILASLLFLFYGVLRNDWVIILGQSITYFIYLRNLYFQKKWQVFPIIIKTLMLVLPFALIASVFTDLPGTVDRTSFQWTSPMAILGFTGQAMLNLRFVHQWYHLEKSQQSTLPKWFWILSIAGSVLLLVYAFNHPVHGIDPVMILSQSMGMVVYVRNLFILKNSGSQP